MAGPKSALEIGDVVASNYEIIGLAGAGGMGVVYKARDCKLGRTVALKFLPSDLGYTEISRSRFLREAQIASILDHPNIGVVHGIEEASNGRSFIVMAFYDGHSLATRLAKGPMPLTEALDIFIQIASGLAEAHARGFVHRDIKPSNIMLTSSGLVKIVDFGLARIAEETVTVGVGATGTVSYMSPEQSLGKPTDQRTDIWSLGVVMAEVLTGANPFLRETLAATAVAIVNDSPGELEGVQPGLKGVIYRALSKDPVKRYQSCGEMLRDLEEVRLASGGAPATEPSRRWERTVLRSAMQEASRAAWMPVKPKRRWRKIAAGAVVVVVLALAPLLIPGNRDAVRSWFSGSGGEKHVAVLPFDNIQGNPQNEAFVEGMMDSLSGKLSNLDVGNQSLWVIPASEVRRLNITDPETALRKLGANLVVKGSVSRQGTAVRLNVSLIDTTNMRQLGSAEVEDAAGDLSMVQNEAVARLARLMNIKVTAEMLRATGGSVNPASYEAYLSALGYMQRYDKAGNLDQAIHALQNATRDDPRFALGYAQLAEAYRLKNRVDQDPKWLNEALANAKRAVDLDNKIPAVHVTLARIHAMLGHDNLALQEYQQALRLNPREGSALSGLAHAYESSGRVADAEDAYKKAAALQSDSWDAYDELGNFYDRQGKYQQSIDQYKKALQLTPDNAQVYMNMGATYLDWANPNLRGEAEKALRKSIELGPSYAAYANLGNLYLSEQRYAESAAMTEKALELNSNDYQVWNNLWLAYGWLKQEDKAENARQKMQSLIEQQIRLKPKDASAQALLAVLLAKNKPEQAKSYVGTALALAPADPNVLVLVSETYELLGDRKHAINYLKQGLQKGYPIEQVKGDPEMQSVLGDPGLKGLK